VQSRLKKIALLDVSMPQPLTATTHPATAALCWQTLVSGRDKSGIALRRIRFELDIYRGTSIAMWTCNHAAVAYIASTCS
jgi:hypothetical protein